MSNGNKSAYPIHSLEVVSKNGYGAVGQYELKHQGGLTKREMFAMAAMQGIIAGFDPESKYNGRFIPSREYPLLMSQAVQIADELLKQLAQ